MDLKRVNHSLENLFNDDRRWAHLGRRLVFWYDAAGEFADDIDDLALPGVTVVSSTDHPFALKRQLLIKDPDTPYLIYSPHPEPEAAHNWLLDLQLTGVQFTADRAAIIFADLGFYHRPLENVIREQQPFFRAEKRLSSLRALNLPKEANERELMAGLLAVVAGLKVAEPQAIIRQVLLGGLEEDNKVWQELRKLGLEDAFWTLVYTATGFQAETPTLRRLLITLLLAHLAHQVPVELPAHLSAQLPTSTTPAYSLISSWMRDSRDHQALQELIAEVEDDLGIQQWAAAQTLTDLRGLDTFPIFEPVALKGMVAALSDGGRPAEIKELAEQRMELHYAGRFQAEYRAILAAADFLARHEQFAGSFPTDAKLLLERYTADWYQFDRLYREYISAADQASKDLLSELTARTEHLYVEWFQAGLNQAWTDAFSPALSQQLDVKRRQWQFYRWHVQPLLEKNDRDRVVVIISDALRYEVASELREAIVADLRGEPALDYMLSVLPSQTRWGMAALLPGENLRWDAGAERVLRSGLPTHHADRAAHLQRTGYPSLVMKLDELMALSTEAARAEFEGKRLVYLYHDAIDALGDKPASESDVFSGCSNASQELARAVKRLANSLNSSTVLVTADHGFLYQRQKIEEPDKLPVPAKGSGITTDRRAIVGEALLEAEGSLRVQLDEYQAVDGPLQGLFPRSSLRYRTQGGGSQYVHGGASLQEMVVPVLTYRHRRATPGGAQASRKVRAEVVSSSRRVTNNFFNVALVQAEAVAERVRSRTVKVQMVDSEGRAVTDQKAVALTSASPHPTERQQVVRLSVTIPDPDEHATYFLTVVDEEDGLELIREPWQIRIAFKDDFGF